MKKNTVIAFSILFSTYSLAQVGVNTTTPESTFDVRAKNHLGIVSGTDGVLVPRVSNLSTDGTMAGTVNGTVNGQLVYLTVDSAPYTQGFHYWDGSKWNRVGLSSDSWNLKGNSGTSEVNNFLGTTDNHALKFRVNNNKAGRFDSSNTILGYDSESTQPNLNYATIFGIQTGNNINALAPIVIGARSVQSGMTGSYNIVMGYYSGNALGSGTQNIFIGDNLGNTISTGNFNIGIGSQALGGANGALTSNIAIGRQAGNIAQGSNNVMIGDNAGFHFTGGNSLLIGYGAGSGATGDQNIVMGTRAGEQMGGGVNNIIMGNLSGQFATGNNNVAIGLNSLSTTGANGSNNTFLGTYSGVNVTSGDNVFIGTNSGNGSNTSGGFNTFVGSGAGQSYKNSTNSVALGYAAGAGNENGNLNTNIGYNSKVPNNSLTNTTALGANSYVEQSNSLVLGSVSGKNGANTTTNVGIGTTAPNSTFQVVGVSMSIKTISGDYTVAASDYTIIKTTINDATVTLPYPATTNIGRIINIMKGYSGNSSTTANGNLTVITSSSDAKIIKGTGVPEASLIISSRATFQSDGNYWYQISGS